MIFIVDKIIYNFKRLKILVKPSLGPELIESIRLTENGDFQTEFEKRDIAALKIQSWWKTKHNNVKIHTNLRELLAKNRRKFVDNSPSILADRESFRKRLINKKSPVSARVSKQTRFSGLVFKLINQ